MNTINFFNTNKLFFGGIKNITLRYVLDKRKSILPERVMENAIVASQLPQENQPTLLQLHQDTYSPLLNCENLDEAKGLFPEFTDVLSGTELENSSSKGVKAIKERMSLENLSLYLLQMYWAILKPQTDIIAELGLPNRSMLEWISKHLKIPTRNLAYNQLLAASTEEGNRKIAAKTTAYNATHQEEMLAKNRHAAQFCKSESYRKAQSERIKQRDLIHPERIEKIKSFMQEVWDRLPEVKQKMEEFSLEQNAETRFTLKKMLQNKPLTKTERILRKTFFRNFWEQHPEALEQYREIFKIVSAERSAEMRKNNDISPCGNFPHKLILFRILP